MMSSLWIKLFGGLALIAAIGFGVYTIRSQGKEIGRLTSDLDQTEDALVQVIDERESVSKLLAAREKRQNRLQGELIKRTNRLREIEKELDEKKPAEKEFKACLDVVVPAVYLDGLRHANNHKGDVDAPPGTAHAGKPQPSTTGQSHDPKSDRVVGGTAKQP